MRRTTLGVAAYYLSRVEHAWRLRTASHRMLPSFIVAGVPKCGTTALFHYLLAHPAVMAPSREEIVYFTQYFGMGPRWYQSHFPFVAASLRRSKALGGARVLTCDHTPSYALHPLAAERIANALPGVKLVFLLRNPVDRAYSHYQHEFRTGHEVLSFRDALAAESERIAGERERMMNQAGFHGTEYVRHAYLDQGRYRALLEPFFHRFRHDDILVVKSEDLSVRPQETLDEVFRFLGLFPYKHRDSNRYNAGDYLRLDVADPSLSQQLSSRFVEVNRSLYDFLGRDFGW